MVWHFKVGPKYILSVTVSINAWLALPQLEEVSGLGFGSMPLHKSRKTTEKRQKESNGIFATTKERKSFCLRDMSEDKPR